jgi:hypothetical protein
MTRELITSWHDHDLAVERLFSIAQEKILIYANELTPLKLDSEANHAAIKQFLKKGQADCLQVILRNALNWQYTQPRLAALCLSYSHLISFREAPADLAHLTDSMLLIDNTHALVRFDEHFARSKLLIDEAEEIRPYVLRFSQIHIASSELASQTTLGL